MVEEFCWPDFALLLLPSSSDGAEVQLRWSSGVEDGDGDDGGGEFKSKPSDFYKYCSSGRHPNPSADWGEEK